MFSKTLLKMFNGIKKSRTLCACLLFSLLVVVSCSDSNPDNTVGGNSFGKINSIKNKDVIQNLFLPKSPETNQSFSKKVLSTISSNQTDVTDKIVSDVIHITTNNGQIREMVFNDSNNKSIRLKLSSIKQLGDRYVFASVDKLVEVDVVEDIDGKQIVTPTSNFTTCQASLLIDIKTRNIYDLNSIFGKEVYPFDSCYGEPFNAITINNNQLLVAYGYYYENSFVDKLTYYSIDLNTMSYVQRNEPKYDPIYTPWYFNTGDLLSVPQYPEDFFYGTSLLLFPKNLEPRINAKFANMEEFSYMKSPSYIPNILNVWVKRSEVSSYGNYYVYSLENLLGHGHLLSPLEMGNLYNPQQSGTFRDDDGEYYVIDIQTHYEKPTLIEEIDSLDCNRNPYSCESFSFFEEHEGFYACRFNDNGTVMDCHEESIYLVLSKIQIEDNKLKKTEVYKTPYNSPIYTPPADNRGTYANIGGLSDTIDDWRASYEAIKNTDRLYQDIVIYDNTSFFRVDVNKEEKITKTDWKLYSSNASLFNGSCYDKSCVIRTDSKGLTWINEDKDKIYYIPFEEDAEVKIIASGSFADELSLSGDIIYYTERVTTSSFATFAINVKTGEKEKISSSQMNIGTLLEFKL